MAKANKEKSIDESKLIAKLLQSILAIELWRGGLSQAEIGKRLGLATATVNKMLKGVRREISVVSNN